MTARRLAALALGALGACTINGPAVDYTGLLCTAAQPCGAGWFCDAGVCLPAAGSGGVSSGAGSTAGGHGTSSAGSSGGTVGGATTGGGTSGGSTTGRSPGTTGTTGSASASGGSSGGAAPGTPCTQGGDCRSGACLGNCCAAGCGTGGVCTATACDDSGACVYPKVCANTCTTTTSPESLTQWSCSSAGTCSGQFTIPCSASAPVCNATATACVACGDPSATPCPGTTCCDVDSGMCVTCDGGGASGTSGGSTGGGCQPPGAPCNSTEPCCATSVCSSSGTCQSSGFPGMPCAVDAACASGLCLDGSCCADGGCLVGSACGAKACAFGTGACIYPTGPCGSGSCDESTDPESIIPAATCANGSCSASSEIPCTSSTPVCNDTFTACVACSDPTALACGAGGCCNPASGGCIAACPHPQVCLSQSHSCGACLSSGVAGSCQSDAECCPGLVCCFSAGADGGSCTTSTNCP
ncbi:MAG TPA: hypothetical protein VMB50_04500 [Myxococcales bacterium]|nr:hypothetical protein [Myxococcales bacterium]